jgi:hypothetical protein
MDGELPHDRLPGPGGCGNEHAVTASQREAALSLEFVQAEGVELREVAEEGPVS